MKTQISHPSTRANSQYSGVYQQQGRMITDADWNAMTDIEKQRLRAALLDAINSGAPREGGLALLSDENDNDILKIKAGTLYVDGLRAELPGPELYRLDEQPHYPIAALPEGLPDFNGEEDLRLYADVWERSVTALEDPGLMDPALHGADTTSRSETLLQVKWRPEGTDQPPGIGDAELALSLRNIYVSNDKCDPCASEMDLGERIGTYLFRVEVHDVETIDGDEILTLKWSRDNGAEAHASDNYPTGFNLGHWVWEFFDEDSEKSLGQHLGTPAPKRGQLTSEFSVPDDAPNKFVRQWDGYLKFNLTQEKLVNEEAGQWVDRGTALSTGLDPDAHGWVGIDKEKGVLELNTEQLEWRLRFRDPKGGNEETDESEESDKRKYRTFVPGGYWQAAIRETVHKSGDPVLGAGDRGERPLGVQHHLLDLRTLNKNGSLKELDEDQKRQFAFPPLTDIQAKDIGFDNDCHDLYGESPNVQEALDTLCKLNAGDIPLTDDLCHYLKERSSKTVQDALNALCARESRGGGCAQVVEPDELLTVLKRAAEEAKKGDDTLWLCLKPGEHVWPRDIQAHYWRHIRISGAGALTTHLYFEELETGPNLVGGQQVSLQDISLRSVYGLALAGEELTLKGVKVHRNKEGDKPFPELSLTDLNAELIKARLGRRVTEGEVIKPFGGEHTLNRVRLEHCHITSTTDPALYLQRPRETLHLLDNTILGAVIMGEGATIPDKNSLIELDERAADNILVDPETPYVDTKLNQRWSREEREREREEPEVVYWELEGRAAMDHRRSHIFLNNNWINRWISVFREEEISMPQGKQFVTFPGPASLQASGNIFGYASSFHAKQLTFQNNRIAPTLDGQKPSEGQPQLVLVTNQFMAQGNMGEVERKEGGRVLSPEGENNKLVHALLFANISMHSNNLIEIKLLEQPV